MSITNPIHHQLLKTLSQYRSYSDQKELDWVKRYLGTNKIYQGINTKNLKEITRNLIKDNNFDQKNLIDLLDSLYENGTTFSELVIAATLLGKLPKLRQKIDIQKLDHWLNYTCGWAENDVLCQSNFTAEEVLSRWPEWQRLLKQFAIDKNINKRRASLVLLTKSLRQSDDPCLSKLAFEQVEKLKHEKDILITKAISWILRSSTKHHAEEVTKYLEDNKESLPKIAIRETTMKLLTGKKYIISKNEKTKN